MCVGGGVMSYGHRDTQQNDIQQNDIQHHSIICLFVTLTISDSRQNDTHHYVTQHEYHYVGCRVCNCYAECHYGKCRYAECRGDVV